MKLRTFWAVEGAFAGGAPLRSATANIWISTVTAGMDPGFWAVKAGVGQGYPPLDSPLLISRLVL